MTGRVELARQQWERSYRLLAGPTDGAALPERVKEQVDAVRDELRRRLGGPFTLAELADVYESSARWAHDAIAERCPRPGWSRSAADATDAAFYLFAPAARDFRP